jgi:hypothetical protein
MSILLILLSPRPGCHTADELKGKKAVDDDIVNSMDRIAKARLQANEDRKLPTRSTNS